MAELPAGRRCKPNAEIPARKRDTPRLKKAEPFVTSTLHWFETELLTREENLVGLKGISRKHDLVGVGFGPSTGVKLEMSVGSTSAGTGRVNRFLQLVESAGFREAPTDDDSRNGRNLSSKPGGPRSSRGGRATCHCRISPLEHRNEA
jgi:hypothetical protein